MTQTVTDAMRRIAGLSDAPFCMVLWSMTDVILYARQIGVAITRKQAAEVIEAMERRHDAEVGITWITLDVYVRDAAAELWMAHDRAILAAEQAAGVSAPRPPALYGDLCPQCGQGRVVFDKTCAEYEWYVCDHPGCEFAFNLVAWLWAAGGVSDRRVRVCPECGGALVPTSDFRYITHLCPECNLGFEPDELGLAH